MSVASNARAIPKRSDETWYRVGGRWLDVHAPLDEFARELLPKLPPALAPYVVVGEDVFPIALATAEERAEKHRALVALLGERAAERSMRKPSQFIRRVYVEPFETILATLASVPPGATSTRRRVCLGSLALSPWLRAPDVSDDHGTLLINGLPMLETARVGDAFHIGSLTAIEKVRHETTGELEVNEAYGVVYKVVRKVGQSLARRYKTAERSKAAIRAALREDALD